MIDKFTSTASCCAMRIPLSRFDVVLEVNKVWYATLTPITIGVERISSVPAGYVDAPLGSVPV